MIEKAKNIIVKYSQLSKQIESPDNINDHAKLALLAKEQSELENIYQHCKKYIYNKKTFSDNASLIHDSDEDIAAIAKEENEELGEEIKQIESKLKLLFIPKDPNDKKNVILEIRAGTGGSEACLFANDLYRMYLRFAEEKNGTQIFLILVKMKGGA